MIGVYIVLARSGHGYEAPRVVYHRWKVLRQNGEHFHHRILLRLKADFYDVFTGHPCSLVIAIVEAGAAGANAVAAVECKKPVALSTAHIASK